MHVPTESDCMSSKGWTCVVEVVSHTPGKYVPNCDYWPLSKSDRQVGSRLYGIVAVGPMPESFKERPSCLSLFSKWIMTTPRQFETSKLRIRPHQSIFRNGWSLAVNNEWQTHSKIFCQQGSESYKYEVSTFIRFSENHYQLNLSSSNLLTTLLSHRHAR